MRSRHSIDLAWNPRLITQHLAWRFLFSLDGFKKFLVTNKICALVFHQIFICSFFFSLQRRRMCSSLERLWHFHSIRCFLFFLFFFLFVCWCCSSKTRQFFHICSNNVNEFYSFIITINDNHQHDVSHSHSRSFTTYLLNVIPTSTTWCMASSVHFLHVKRRRTSKLQQQQQQMEKKNENIWINNNNNEGSREMTMNQLAFKRKKR